MNRSSRDLGTQTFFSNAMRRHMLEIWARERKFLRFHLPPIRFVEKESARSWNCSKVKSDLGDSDSLWGWKSLQTNDGHLQISFWENPISAFKWEKPTLGYSKCSLNRQFITLKIPKRFDVASNSDYVCIAQPAVLWFARCCYTRWILHGNLHKELFVHRTAPTTSNITCWNWRILCIFCSIKSGTSEPSMNRRARNSSKGARRGGEPTKFSCFDFSYRHTKSTAPRLLSTQFSYSCSTLKLGLNPLFVPRIAAGKTKNVFNVKLLVCCLHEWRHISVAWIASWGRSDHRNPRPEGGGRKRVKCLSVTT